MLAHQWHKTAGIPVVFLHGLLGSQQDWANCFAHLAIFPKIRPLTLDLPFHGESQSLTCHSFDDIRTQLHTTLQALICEPFWLVGYSLGGRIALDYHLKAQNPHLVGTILEGANIGLRSQAERQARWQNDTQWARRFRTEPIPQVLADWYQQPVFRALRPDQKQELIQQRQHNAGEQIAQMLEATSLAKQDNFQESDWQNITFLIGEQDHKFRQMATEYHLPYRLIAHAGHNAHWENPQTFIQQLKNIIEGKENGTPSLP